MMNSSLTSFLISFFAGALYSLAYPSFLGGGWFPLLFIALPLFLWQLEKSANFRQIALVILSYNLGLDVVGYYWIPHTMREFGQLPYLISLLIGLSFSLILQPHWWAYTIWKKWRPPLNWHTETGILTNALMITLLERYFPQQFPSFAGSPWLHLAPYLGLAPYFGVAIFSFMTYWLCLEVVNQLKLKQLRPTVWIIFSAFVGLNALLPLTNPVKTADLPVRLVQANIGNFLKVESEHGDTNSYESIRNKYHELSTAEGNPALIIWPETAYPNTFYGRLSKIDAIFLDIMKATNAEMLIGGYDQDTSKSPFDLHESLYNSSILLSGGKVKASYHKNILIPFGETLPFGPFNEDVISVVPAVSLFARGYGTPKMETQSGYRFVTPICYEILDTNFLRTLLNQWGNNHFIVNHTNDSWYGDTAEPYQHLFLSKWRALEFRLPILRSTNTGITSVIFPDGTESKRLSIGEENFLDVEVPIAPAQNTFYQLYGIYPLLGLFLFLVLISIVNDRRKTY